MTEPAIQPSQRRSTALPQHIESPEEFLHRTEAELPQLTGDEAQARLHVLRSCVGSGTLTRSEVRGITRSLERRISESVQADAPGNTTRREARPNRRFDQAVQGAYSTNHSSAAGFLSALRREVGSADPDNAIRQALSRTSTHDFERSLVSAGASPETAREVRGEIESHFADRFAADVQAHIVGSLGEAKRSFAAAASGSGTAFDSALQAFLAPGTQGQTLLRALRVLNPETSQRLGRLYDDIGRHPQLREELVAEMAKPFTEAMEIMRDQLIDTQNAVTHTFEEERYAAFSEFPGALRQVSQDWGLPRTMHRGGRNIPGQHGSVIAHGVRERMVDAAEHEVTQQAIDTGMQIVTAVLVPVVALARVITRAVQLDNDAEHEAALAAAGAGDIGDAEADEAENEISASRIMFNVATNGASAGLVETAVGQNRPYLSSTLRQVARPRTVTP